MTSSKRTRWPVTMPWLTPSDFVSQAWSTGPSIVSDLQFLEDTCGYRMCLVGWVRNAFGLPAAPSDITGRLPSQGERFLHSLAENTGRSVDPSLTAQGLCYAVGDAMDGLGEYSAAPALTTRQAATAWRKTLKHFGYTEIGHW